ncbi:hypothetical protein V6767_19430, partial [Martelella sp. FLE1502]
MPSHPPTILTAEWKSSASTCSLDWSRPFVIRRQVRRKLMQTRVKDAADWKEACRIYARDLADCATGLA